MGKRYVTKDLHPVCNQFHCMKFLVFVHSIKQSVPPASYILITFAREDLIVYNLYWSTLIGNYHVWSFQRTTDCSCSHRTFKKDSFIVSCEWNTFKSIFVIMRFIRAYTYSSITCQQNDYLSINGHQKTKEMSKFKKIVNFKKGIGIKRYNYTQFTTVTLIMKST